MSSFAKISIRFNADLKQFSSELQNAQRKMQKVGLQMQRVGSGLTLGVTLPILGIGAASVKAASDAEETASKFNTVFRDISKAATDAADELRNSYGLSSNASRQLLSDTGDLLTGFGFSQQAALDLSTDVNKLAVDLASFTNFSGGAEGASQALTKALLGERESVKSLGISILEADVQAKVLENTQKGLTFESERQAKAFATLQLAQEQSKNAIGDYARTNQSFANQMRLVKARIEDVAVQFGEILLPFVTKLAGKIGQLVDYFSRLDPAVKKTILVVAGLAAALGPVIFSLGVLVTNIIPALSIGFTALTGPIGLVIAAIAGIAVVVYKNWDRIKKEMNELRNYFVDLYNESIVFRAGIESVILVFKNLYNIVKLVLNFIVTGFKNGIEFILGSVENLGKAFKAVLTGNLKDLPRIFKEQGKMASQNFKELIGDIGKDINAFTTTMKRDVNDAVDAVTLRKKIAFTQENVDASAIQTAVANAVSEGQSGTPGRAKAKSIDAGLGAGNVDLQRSPLDRIVELMPAQAARMSEIQMQVLANAQEFNERFTEITANTAANFAAGFGELLGNFANGGLNLKNIANLVLSTLADMAIQVGQMAIGIGFAVEGIKKALQSLAGPVAIAAGIALVALGTFAKSALSNVGSGGDAPRAFADGGIVYGPTKAIFGEYAGARTNPEVVAPLDKLKGMIADVGGAGNVHVTGEFKIRNRELVAQVDNAQKSRSRRT